MKKFWNVILSPLNDDCVFQNQGEECIEIHQETLFQRKFDGVE
jgi:hypothetical protein